MSKQADNISDEARAEYQEAFNMFDKDLNGSIEAKEFGDVMKALGHNPTDDELAEMVAGIDTDGDGEIDFDEFLAMMLKQIENTNGDSEGVDAEMMAAFKMFDIDGDGSISKSELKLTMKYSAFKMYSAHASLEN